MDLDEQRRMLVKNAYDELAWRRRNWPNKYDMRAQTAKILSDYALLGKIDLHGKKVLNIGCSEPVDEIFWISIVDEWHALDINEAAIKVAEYLASEVLSPRLLEKLRFINGDATDLALEDEYYDLVVSFSTIDHIPNPGDREKAISEMSRVLKGGGHLVITVPNKWDVVYSRRSNKLQRKGEAVFGYEYQFSPLELKKMIETNGLTIVDYASCAFNPCSYYDRLIRRLGLEKLIIFFGTRFGYLAQKPLSA